ncbi:TRADD-N-associated membrane domain-containing protein [Streptomyces griseoluteus]|uniref:TRADD-N-associated membrane domain-containing protein n=1 Tax=Streptomyces griseoluteus TaxID=29306 RepID=UPI0019ACC22C|nr:hypothetical protein [Streptomyces griseoluteus]GHF03938.1 hypothetical protein GCM10017776_21850 [Streptomyces griseoluteus]
MQGDWLNIAAGSAGAVLAAATVVSTLLATRRGFEREQRETAKRLVGSGPGGGITWGDLAGGNVAVVDREGGEPDGDGTRPGSGARRRDDQFASVLVEYYSYGLTQARRSFYASQVISAVGVLVILSGVTLAIWRAETSGDMFASIVTSCSGVVSTVIGQLVHRRADIALKHMADQTEALRADMLAERAGEQAIALLAGVTDPEVKTRLQAGLIMKLAGAEMPAIGPQFSEAPPVVPEQAQHR